MDFRSQTVKALAASVRQGDRSARELVGHALGRIGATNDKLRAFVTSDGDQAMEQARAVDEAVAHGRDPGPLAGVPIGVKDLEDAVGYVTTFGSAALPHASPAAESSVLVARLTAAGAVVVGKTNTPELGSSSDTSNALFGPTFNPWNVGHSPGGSSGGSAAAVAAGMVPLATGSDGGGSIRIPSSCCGLSGLKPSLGRVPTGGPHPPSWLELSTKGVLGRTMADVVEALEVAVGPEPTELRSLPRPDSSWLAALEDPRPPAQVAWSPTLGYGQVDRQVLAACEAAVGVLAELGAEIITVESLFDEDPIASWSTIANACNCRTIAHLRGTEAWGQVDPMLRASVEAGEQQSALQLVQALDACHRLNWRLVQLFRRVRLLVTPTCAAGPPRSGQSGLIDGLPVRDWVQFTYPFNMTRSPAASVCAGFTEEHLPIGIQLVGPQHADLVVIRAAAALEQGLGLDPVAPGWE